MNAATAALELKASLKQPFHQALHTPGTVDEEVYSRFFDADLKSTWYSTDTGMELTRKEKSATTDEAGCASYDYLIPSGPSFLTTVVMVQQLPTFDVADGFRDTVRIAWTPNLAFAIVRSGILHIGDSETHPIDKHYMAAYFQFNTKPDMRADFEECIGNKPELTDWSTSLPPRQVGCPHPYYFFRMQRRGHITKLCESWFSYLVVNDADYLMRCQILRDGKWENTPLRAEYLVQTNRKLPAPHLFAVSTYNTQPEMASLRSEREDEPRDVYITEVFHISSKNPTSTREVFEVTRTNPAKCVITLLENMEATRNNVHCNYTTDPEDYISGPNPMQFTEISYDVKRRAINRTATVLNKLVVMETCPSVPYRNGYNIIPLCLSPFERLETGVVLGDEKIKASITVQLNSTGPNPVKLFDVHVYLLIQRRLRYTLEADGTHSVEIL